MTTAAAARGSGWPTAALVAAVAAGDAVGVLLVLGTRQVITPASWIVVWVLPSVVAVAGPLLLRIAQAVLAAALTGWAIAQSDPAVLATLQILVFALGALGGVLLVAIRFHQQQSVAITLLERMADTDPLTGVRNRRGLEHAAADALERSSGQRWSVLALDVRGLKAINDQQGHAAGDQRLLEVARELRAAVGADGTVARTGGDEFVVLVPTDRADGVVRAVTSGPVADAVRLGRADGVVGTAEDLRRLVDAADRDPERIDPGLGDGARPLPPVVLATPAAPAAPVRRSAAIGARTSDRTLYAGLVVAFAVIALVGAVLRVSRGEAAPARTLAIAGAQLVAAGIVAVLATGRGSRTRSLGAAAAVTLLVLGLSAVVTTNTAIGTAGVLAWALPVVVGATSWPRRWVGPVVGWIVLARTAMALRVEPTVPRGLLVGLVQAACLVAILLWVRALRARMQQQQDALAVAAATDPLTGLLNRSGLQDGAAGWCDGRTVTATVLDVDGFKRVNDSRGHAAGDAVLTEVAAALRAAAPAGALVARLGGDEFVVVVPAAAADSWTAGLGRELRERRVAVGLSLGTARGPVADADDLWAVVDEADRRLVAGRPHHRRR